MKKNKITLFGSTDLTLHIFNYLLKKGYNLNGVVTIKENISISYSKKKLKNVRFSNLSSIADKHNIPTFFYKNNTDNLNSFLNTSRTEVILVAGWFHNLPPKILNNIKICLGIHSSLLPQLKGHAPLNWAIINEFKKTGVSLFEISKNVDAGKIYARKEFIIKKTDYISDLIEKCKVATLDLLDKNLKQILEGSKKNSQWKKKESYGLNRIPDDSIIDWNLKANKIYDLIRASSRPYSGAFTFLNKKQVIIFKSKIAFKPLVYGKPGQIFVLQKKIYVKCNDFLLEILDAENIGGKQLIEELLKCNHERFK